MDVIQVLTTTITVVSVLGGAAGYFKASRGDSIIRYQGTEIDLRDKKISILEKDVAALSQAGDEKDKTIEELKRHNQDLKELGQGSPQLKKLTVAIENQTRIIESFLRERMGTNGQ